MDVVAQQLCGQLDSTANAGNIEQYRNVIKTHIPFLADSTVTIPRYGLELKPWINWQNDITPDWWRDYNKVKHERNSHFEKANLKNVLNAMSGLLLLIVNYYRGMSEIKRIVPAPTIFTPSAQYAYIASSISGGVALFFS